MRAPITLSSVLTNGYLSSEKPSWQDVESLGVERPHEKDSNGCGGGRLYFHVEALGREYL
ncbi:uncharacterized protein PHALS_02645 [Plasmopara halstedii]|uniref:Uncharacterized protein n=1 Tax=Plasmopara halstedii TaxID=4781 RepID=A0A0P1AWV8_PLAHL|nr:uncharacterized protein PHALS_02645 [Plasmopara halstedii]CEG46231.1 hypothetical protein PHALS_02645 [Plasmopara halstedii]|eukprot:XP_024582600.1 hypothetical protein PHALS_02645 [Plasmopara halstedii]